MSLLNLNKKGQTNNFMTPILVLFTSGFLLIIGYLIILNFQTSMASTSLWTDTLQTTSDNFLWGLRVGDLIMVVVMLCLIIGIGITSYRLATAPVFFIITIIMSAFYGFISYFFNFIFQSFASQSILSTVVIYFPRTILICTNLHWVMLINIIVGSLTFFGKKERGQYV